MMASTWLLPGFLLLVTECLLSLQSPITTSTTVMPGNSPNPAATPRDDFGLWTIEIFFCLLYNSNFNIYSQILPEHNTSVWPHLVL
jgi:hypothetical protein